MTISIVLAEDHQVVRQGLRVLLENESDFAVVGEAADGLETLALVKRLQPQVLLLDLVMPGLHGLEVVRQVVQSWPQTRVVVLSMHADEVYVLQALRGGAFGYVLKESPAAVVIQAVRAAAEGQRYLGPTLSERDIQDYLTKANAGSFDLYETLTSREREVLPLAANGLTSSEIGARLFISPRTVEKHRANVMNKLDLHTHADLVRYAIRRGILPLDR